MIVFHLFILGIRTVYTVYFTIHLISLLFKDLRFTVLTDRSKEINECNEHIHHSYEIT